MSDSQDRDETAPGSAGPGRRPRNRALARLRRDERPAQPDHAIPEELEDHDLGLSEDLPRIVRKQEQALGRRRLLALGGVGALGATGFLAACSSDDSTSSSASSSGSASSSSDRPEPPDGGGGPGGDGGGGDAAQGDSSVEVADGEIPEETAGPYPGDGSNGANVLSESGIVRSDITSSFGDASATAEGVPVTVRMKIYDLSGDDVELLEGAAVYLWHCDAQGNYSMYSEGITEENYLRGVQVADSDGYVEFTSIFPGCYAGRWPHMHFEIYADEDSATSYTNKMRTSQLAIPQATCEEVYGVVDGYDDSVANLANISLDSDNVFSDGYSLQMANVTGSVDEGYTIKLNVPI
ncbi:intradiol ring-cleavage dioxygenase [Nocardioides bruguierae]|uniref:Intradiol ring-cleavage dioxygenase n=1 Tax=Nocardioides bruguierae TaxID=2945102 RepID=A0A9X2IGS3_9ACTN|nr:intradiol ring-cleavage dioxygenase [Nocardioides bruguierae]MCM0621864.1 intradiol ring-cleavage dioxygenase [Nocardioides bruguierae]